MDAEWDNVSTAVEVGASQAQCAVVRAETSRDGLERRFEIKHVSGRHGVVTARVKVLPDPHSPEPESIELSCAMGPIADPQLERKVISRVAHRLKDLKGKAFAPITE